MTPRLGHSTTGKYNCQAAGREQFQWSEFPSICDLLSIWKFSRHKRYQKVVITALPSQQFMEVMISAEARMRMLTGDTFVFWPKGRCQVWRCSDQIFVAEISRRMGKSMEIDLIKNKCGREFFVGLIGRFAAF